MDKKRAWFIAILFFSGLCLTLYPFVSNLIAQSHASQAIAAYDEQVAEMDQEQIDAAKEAVRKYNEQLNAAVEASAMQGEDGISYLDLVDVSKFRKLTYIFPYTVEPTKMCCRRASAIWRSPPILSVVRAPIPC